MKELLGVGPIPANPDYGATDGENQLQRAFALDVAYRQAVVDFERDSGRFAEANDARQPGYDMDSFDKALNDATKRLIRRIEVKGYGCDWTDDFNYWLYVVERL